MAQLGELAKAKSLLRSAARAFGAKEALARARCVVAEAEIALVSRDLTWPAKALDAARARSEEHTSELQSLAYLVCRLLLEKKKQKHQGERRALDELIAMRYIAADEHDIY